MKKTKKAVCVMIIVLLQFNFTSCENINNSKEKQINNKQTNNNQQIDIKRNYSDIVGTKAESSNLKIFNIDDNNIKMIQEGKNLASINYCTQSKKFSYVIFKEHGKNLTHNYLQIYDDKNSKNISLTKEFNYLDIKLSKQGSNIAYRSFAKDNYNSGSGLGIYDIDNSKNIKLPENIILSGNLYEWKDDKVIWYYGIDKTKKNYGSIYAFNVNKNTNKSIYEKFKGYCTYFMVCNDDGILYLENDIEKNNLYYYNRKKHKKVLVDQEFENIYDYVFDKTTNQVFFIGKKSTENNVVMYKYDIKKLQLKKVTYDFPSIVDKNGGIALSGNGKVYFCGFSSDVRKSDIYTYEISSKTTNIITSTEGNYHVYGNVK